MRSVGEGEGQGHPVDSATGRSQVGMLGQEGQIQDGGPGGKGLGSDIGKGFTPDWKAGKGAPGLEITLDESQSIEQG